MGLRETFLFLRQRRKRKPKRKRKRKRGRGRNAGLSTRSGGGVCRKTRPNPPTIENLHPHASCSFIIFPIVFRKGGSSRVDAKGAPRPPGGHGPCKKSSMADIFCKHNEPESSKLPGGPTTWTFWIIPLPTPPPPPSPTPTQTINHSLSLSREALTGVLRGCGRGRRVSRGLAHLKPLWLARGTSRRDAEEAEGSWRGSRDIDIRLMDMLAWNSYLSGQRHRQTTSKQKVVKLHFKIEIRKFKFSPFEKFSQMQIFTSYNSNYSIIAITAVNIVIPLLFGKWDVTYLQIRW